MSVAGYTYTLVILAILGILACVALWVYLDGRRGPRKSGSSPRSWPHCPFCPPRSEKGRLYAQPADSAHANDDGASWEWAWCSRCGGFLCGGKWRAPDPEAWNTYRGEPVAKDPQPATTEEDS